MELDAEDTDPMEEADFAEGRKDRWSSILPDWTRMIRAKKSSSGTVEDPDGGVLVPLREGGAAAADERFNRLAASGSSVMTGRQDLWSSSRLA